MPSTMSRGIVIEPSPVAQNLYRVILTTAPEAWYCDVMRSVESLESLDPEPRPQFLIVSSEAWRETPPLHRAVLTDAAPWCDLPVLVVESLSQTGSVERWGQAPWERLARPFTPRALQDAVRRLIAMPQVSTRARRAPLSSAVGTSDHRNLGTD